MPRGNPRAELGGLKSGPKGLGASRLEERRQRHRALGAKNGDGRAMLAGPPCRDHGELPPS